MFRIAFLRRNLPLAARLNLLAGVVLGVAFFAAPEPARAQDQAAKTNQPERQVIVVPNINLQHGRRLFVLKGCVSCHSINGVGGKAAPALDAPEEGETVNLLDFAARMWRGAAAMQQLQSLELGYRIELTGDEIGDLAGFISSASAQQNFSMDEVPDLLKDWFVDEAYWDLGEWPNTDEWRFPQ